VAECPQFIDLGKFHLRDIAGPGLFSIVPTPLALDIITGKLRLFARFDVIRFFAFADRLGIELTWGNRKESAEAVRRKLSSQIPGSPGRSALAHFRIGEQAKGTLLYGFFLRPFRDLRRSGDLTQILLARGISSREATPVMIPQRTATTLPRESAGPRQWSAPAARHQSRAEARAS
jgi:hypothetical protein